MSPVDQSTRLQPAVAPAKTPRKPKRGKGAPADRQVSVAGHPRVSRTVRAAKGWGGLAGFVLVALASSGAGAETFDVLLRALLGGIAGWLVAWVVAVNVGRTIVRAEVEAHREARIAAIEAENEERRRRIEEAEAAAEAARDDR